MVQRTVSTNVIGTRNVVSACEEFGAATRWSPRPGRRSGPTRARSTPPPSGRRNGWSRTPPGAAGRATPPPGSPTSSTTPSSPAAAQLGEGRRRAPARSRHPLLRPVRARIGSAHAVCRAAGAARSPAGQRDQQPGLASQPARPGHRDAAGRGLASPIYFSGHDPGYESVPFPGLYDPATAGELSPLLSAFEAAAQRRARARDRLLRVAVRARPGVRRGPGRAGAGLRGGSPSRRAPGWMSFPGSCSMPAWRRCLRRAEPGGRAGPAARV